MHRHRVFQFVLPELGRIRIDQAKGAIHECETAFQRIETIGLSRGFPQILDGTFRLVSLFEVIGKDIGNSGRPIAGNAFQGLRHGKVHCLPGR